MGVVTGRGRVLDLADSNRLLPRVRTILARIRRREALRRRLEGEMIVLQVLSDMTRGSNAEFLEFIDKNVRFHRLGGQIDALVEHLASLGCVVRNRDAAWVDFVFLRADGLAHMCWHAGESDIAHWHHMHESHDVRRPLAELHS